MLGYGFTVVFVCVCVSVCVCLKRGVTVRVRPVDVGCVTH